MLKVQRKGSAGKMIAISEDGKPLEWFVITSTVQPYIDKFNVGDEVTIKSDKKSDGKSHLIYIGLVNAAPAGSTTQAPTEKKTWSPKSPEEQNSIKRQAIGHMVSRTLIGMQGAVNEGNVEALIDKLYAKYVVVVG